MCCGIKEKEKTILRTLLEIIIISLKGENKRPRYVKAAIKIYTWILNAYMMVKMVD